MLTVNPDTHNLTFIGHYGSLGPLTIGRVYPEYDIVGKDGLRHFVGLRVVREATFDEWHRNTSDISRAKYPTQDTLPAGVYFYAVQVD